LAIASSFAPAFSSSGALFARDHEPVRKRMSFEHANLLKKAEIFRASCLPSRGLLMPFANFTHYFFSFVIAFFFGPVNQSASFPGRPTWLLFPPAVCCRFFRPALGNGAGGANVFFPDVQARPFGIICHVLVLADARSFYSPPSCRRGRVIDGVQSHWPPSLARSRVLVGEGTWPAWSSLTLVMTICAFALCACRLRLFRRHSVKWVDELYGHDHSFPI